MKSILIIVNHFIAIYAFRQELIIKLLNDGHRVIIALPHTDEVSIFAKMGCEIIDTPLERRKTNPINDFKLLINYYYIIKKTNPDIVLTYTIKPNIYGGLAARLAKSKVIHTVTGLGSVYIQEMWQKKIVVLLNKISFKKANEIFFLNDENRKFYQDIGIINLSHYTKIVSGSGVNLSKFKFVEMNNTGEIVFTFVGRILKDKGIDEFLESAKIIKNRFPNTQFRIAGFADEEKYFRKIKQYEEEGYVSFLGKRDDIADVMANSTCIVLPSYGEGRGTALQEGAAIGRPLITCDTYGCKENVEDGKNGYLCKVADVDSLANCFEKLILLTGEERASLGRYSREKAEKEFDRDLIINTYVNEINKIIF